LAVDLAQLTRALCRFYDFTGKVAVYVGAGSRQLLDPTVHTRKKIYIDQDSQALEQLRANLATTADRESEVIASRFEDVNLAGDVVYFEFCLHEMDDPVKALNHARSLAPDIVVFDHSPGSEWIFYGAEDAKVRDSAQAMLSFGIRKQETYRTEQRFHEFSELFTKMEGQGPVAKQRVQRFAGAKDITIPMKCELVLL
jgi:hypothetical protein